MHDFPSCFGESGVQIADSSTTSSPSSSLTSFPAVTCLYHAHLGIGSSSTSLLITVTWTRSLLGPALALSIDDHRLRPLCKVHIKPSLFSTRKGSRPLLLPLASHSAELFWDLSSATFPSSSSPEPLSGFYVALVLDLDAVLLLGDLAKDAYRRTGAHPPLHPAALLTRREHLSGKRLYSTRALLAGGRREIAIEFGGGGGEPSLEIRVDRRRVVHVKRLAWKFRGNQTIVVDGSPVEVLWDVHGWLFGAPPRCAVFVFHSCAHGPEAASGDPWEEPAGSSLVLHAWKNE